MDLYKAKAKMFQIVDGKLMPSFASIEGMGDKAAEAVEEAGKDGPYLSLDDFPAADKSQQDSDRSDVGAGTVWKSAEEQSVIVV